VHYAPSLAGAIALASLLFASASMLAVRHRAKAGLCLLMGYAVPAVTLYAQEATVRPPSLLLVVSMLALMMASARGTAVHDPAA
jgi:hypothetical protein